jgi:hypothetical protein
MDSSSDLGSGSPADVGGAGVRQDSAFSEGESVPSDLVVRDDAADFPALRDAAKSRRGSGSPLKVIDAGKLPAPELEWLGRAGAAIYSSDAAGRTARELVLVSDAAKKGGASVSYFHHGPFAEGEGGTLLPFTDLLELGRSGLHLYVSNAKIPRDFAALDTLAYACEKGGSKFGYYHDGTLEPGLEDLARRGAWIHVHVRSVASDADAVFLADCARAGRPSGAGVVLHVDVPIDAARIADLMAAGVHFLFLTPPCDYRSPVRPLEEKARRRPLDPRAYFLYPGFML